MPASPQAPGAGCWAWSLPWLLCKSVSNSYPACDIVNAALILTVGLSVNKCPSM